MEYRESSGWYVDREELTITYYEAWYELTERDDGTIRCFLVPGSLEKETIPLTVFCQMLFVYSSAKADSLPVSEVMLFVAT